MKVNLPKIPDPVTIDPKFFKRRDDLVNETWSLLSHDVARDSVWADNLGNLLSKIHRLGKDFEEQRKEISRPFLKAQRKIKEVADREAKLLTDAKKSIKDALSKYAAEQEKAKKEEMRRGENFAGASEESPVKIHESTGERMAHTKTVVTVGFEVVDESIVPIALKSVDPKKVRAYISENKQLLLDILEDGKVKPDMIILGLKLIRETKVVPK